MEKYTAVVRQGSSDLQVEQPRWKFNLLTTVAQEYGSMSLHDAELVFILCTTRGLSCIKSSNKNEE